MANETLLCLRNVSDIFVSHFRAAIAARASTNADPSTASTMLHHNHFLFTPLHRLLEVVRSQLASLARLDALSVVLCSLPLVFVDLDRGRKLFPEGISGGGLPTGFDFLLVNFDVHNRDDCVF